MSHHDDDYGYGPVFHPLEDDGKGMWNWERGILATLLFFPLVSLQFLVLFVTPLGMLLAVTGMLSREEYGPLFSQPLPIALGGVIFWIALRYARLGLTRLFGGGAVRRSELYRERGA